MQTGAAALPLDSTFKSFSPRVSLDWSFAPGSMAYALYSRGYKPGGFNSIVSTLSPAQIAFLITQGGNGNPTFDQERLDNYEVGF